MRKKLIQSGILLLACSVSAGLAAASEWKDPIIEGADHVGEGKQKARITDDAVRKTLYQQEWAVFYKELDTLVDEGHQLVKDEAKLLESLSHERTKTRWLRHPAWTISVKDESPVGDWIERLGKLVSKEQLAKLEITPTEDYNTGYRAYSPYGITYAMALIRIRMNANKPSKQLTEDGIRGESFQEDRPPTLQDFKKAFLATTEFKNWFQEGLLDDSHALRLQVSHKRILAWDQAKKVAGWITELNQGGESAGAGELVSVEGRAELPEKFLARKTEWKALLAPGTKKHSAEYMTILNGHVYFLGYGVGAPFSAALPEAEDIPEEEKPKPKPEGDQQADGGSVVVEKGPCDEFLLPPMPTETVGQTEAAAPELLDPAALEGEQKKKYDDCMAAQDGSGDGTVVEPEPREEVIADVDTDADQRVVWLGSHAQGLASSEILRDVIGQTEDKSAWEGLTPEQTVARKAALQSLFREANDARDPSSPTKLRTSWDDEGVDLPEGVTSQDVDTQRQAILVQGLATSSEAMGEHLSELGLSGIEDGEKAFAALYGSEPNQERLAGRIDNEIESPLRSLYGRVLGAFRRLPEAAQKEMASLFQDFEFSWFEAQDRLGAVQRGGVEKSEATQQRALAAVQALGVMEAQAKKLAEAAASYGSQA